MNIVIDGLNYKLNLENKTASVTKEKIDKEDIVVLECVEHDGIKYTVTSLGEGAFSWCEKIKSIKLPDTIEILGADAFYSCELLSSLNIPKNLKKLNKNAFRYCKLLDKIEIPHGIETIHWGTFSFCKGLKQFDIPKSVTEVDNEAFEYCSSLEVLSVPKGVNTKFINNLIDSSNILKHVILDEEDLFKNKKIAEYVFSYVGSNPNLYNSDIVTKGLKRKKEWILLLMKALKPEILSLLFDNKICSLDLAKELSEDLKMNSECKALFLNYINSASLDEKKKVKNNATKKQDIDLGLENCTLKDIRKEWKCSVVEGKVVFKSYVGARKTPVIPGSIDGISSYVFNAITENDILTQLTFANGVKSIELECFKNLQLRGIWRNNGDAFMKCLNLNTIILPQSLLEFKANYEIQGDMKYLSQQNDDSLSEVVYVGDSLLSMGDYSITDFKVKEGTKNIQLINSKNYKNLSSVFLPESVEKICDYAFNNCSSLININFPGNLKYIGDYGLYGCKIENAIISDSVQIIGECAFEHCNNLKKISIPKSLSIIPHLSFAYCKSLIDVIIPNNIVKIDFAAFESCTSLTSITIPNSVKKIWIAAFEKCSNLSSVVFEEGSEIDAINNYTFSECTSLTSITIPNNVVSIGENAFFSCKKLAEVNMPDCVTSIANNAFRLCESLKKRPKV